MDKLTLPLIQEASSFLKGKLNRTPLDLSMPLSEKFGVPVHLKLEFLQKTGSFKPRGALFYLSKLSKDETKNGVITCSAGNHGQGVAYAAGKLGIPATVYAPSSLDNAKHASILALGAEVILADVPSFDVAQDMALKASQAGGKPYITPYDNVNVMAANGGALAVEVYEDCPTAKTHILPVGGGGLSGGYGFFMKNQDPSVRIIGCQHEGSASLKASLDQDKAVTQMPPLDTLAGGLEGGIGEVCYPHLKHVIDDTPTASESDIKQAVKYLAETHRFMVEPSAAVVLACILNGQIQIKDETVILLSGRNMSLDTFKECLN